MTVLPAALSLVASLVLVASMWAWVFALKKLLAGQPLLSYEPRRTAPWNLLDIFVVFVLYGLLQFLVFQILGGADALSSGGAANPTAEPQEFGEIDSVTLRWANVLAGTASLLVCGLGSLAIVLRTRARWGQDLGFTLRHAGRDVAYGVVAFVMMAPIIYAIQLTLVQWYPSEHPLIEQFRANPTWGFYLVCVFSAAIVAPVFEEFVCRVLLQGLFERIAVSPSVESALFGQLPRDATPPADESSLQSSLERNPEGVGIAGRIAPEDIVPKSASAKPTASLNAWQLCLPILFSSLVFAGMHLGHGLDPIPLFFLAVGLGYLYQRTHRILPCIVVHFLVNALALAMLGMSFVAE